MRHTLHDSRRTLSKVDLGFLKDHIPAHELDFSSREQGPAAVLLAGRGKDERIH
jgi:hypothetical protein